MTKIILYDKDGTLLNYQKIWTPYAKKCLHDFESHFNLGYNQTFRESLGLKDGVIKENSILACGTGRDIHNAFESRIKNGGKWAKKHYDAHMNEFTKYMELLPGAKEALKTGKNLGYKNAIVTSDSRQSTTIFIEKFNLSNDIDYLICGDDSVYSKPDAKILTPLIQEGYDYKDIVVVGDNETDTLLGKNKGTKTIGVLSGTSSESHLTGATIIVNSVKDLFQDGKFILNES